MVLTDRQRSDLHAGIYEYFLSRGSNFAQVAEALSQADPEACSSAKAQANAKDKSNESSSPTRTVGGAASTPVLEKKWTAVPRLQKRVIELERQIATNAKIHAHRAAASGSSETAADGSLMPGKERRMLPRPPAVHTLQSHSGVVTTVAVHPIYTMAASGSEDGTIKLWDHESGDYLRTLRGHTNVVTCVDFSPRGTHLASTSTDLSIKIWDVKEFTCVRTLRGHDHTISCVRFVPPPLNALYLDKDSAGGRSGGGAEAAAGGAGGGGVDPSDAGSKFIVTSSRDATIKFWDLETGFCDHTISDHGDWVRCIAVRPASAASGKKPSNPASTGETEGESAVTATSTLALVATSGNDRNIYVYDANDKREKVVELRGPDHVVESLSFLCSSLLPRKGGSAVGNSASWDYLASGGRDRTVRLWNIGGGGTCLMVFRAHENWVRGVLVHPSGNHLLSCGDDRTIRVFDIKSNRCLRTIEDAHPHFVTSVSMHHTLPILISGGVDHTVKCWQLD